MFADTGASVTEELAHGLGGSLSAAEGRGSLPVPGTKHAGLGVGGIARAIDDGRDRGTGGPFARQRFGALDDAVRQFYGVAVGTVPRR